MDTAQYLNRLNVEGPYAVAHETLRRLHVAHMRAIPFENLNIPIKRPIILDEEALYRKIVACRRGGFCYELNGLFSALLRELGFTVDRLSARVWTGEKFSQEFDHMALIVHLDDGDWLADVGFGDCFLEPLRMVADVEQTVLNGTYRLSQQEDRWLLESKKDDGTWANEYLFSTTPHPLSDFEEMCLWQQTSPDSAFTGRRVCSRATPDGRITLSEQKLIITKSGQREEHALSDEQAVTEALQNHFGVDLTLV